MKHLQQIYSWFENRIIKETGSSDSKINRIFLTGISAVMIPVIYFLWPASVKDSPLRYINNSVHSASLTPFRPLPLRLNYDSSRAALGEMLYNEKKLSPDSDVSCRSCHDSASFVTKANAYRDHKDLMKYNLDVPVIFNSVLNSRRFRDGRSFMDADQLNIEHRSEDDSKIQSSEIVRRLAADGNYKKLFSENYPDGITYKNVKNSLLEYLKTLITPNSKFDRFLRGEEELSEKEIEGYDLFVGNGCVNCHQGINLGGNFVHYLGAYKTYYSDGDDVPEEDFGLYNVTGWEEDKYKFRVSSLRNVAETAPYLHDGSIATLEKTVQIMAEYQLGISLGDEEIDKITVFLHTLTGEINTKQ